jgi:CSLREA domain-containing protein
VTSLRPRVVLLAALCAALLALAVPGWAAAAVFKVNGTGDGAIGDAGVSCVAAGECTLRAAIQGANESSVGTDVIDFDPTVFNGEPADTIAPALLPELTAATTIDGAGCNPGSTVPCLSGANASGFALLAVKGAGSTVENLKMTIPAGGFGIRVIGTGSSNPGIAILDNTMALTGTTPPTTGIGAIGTTSAAGNLIEGNKITTPLAANFDYPISLRSGLNRVIGNVLEGAGCCQAGITIDLGNNGNQIGGDTEASENVIQGFSGAVTMDGTSGHNDVRRNRGANASNFINGSATAAPTVAGGFRSVATGTGEPGATVRVFLSESEGEIGGFLGQAIIEGSGTWKVPYPAVPIGTTIAATQTLSGATSALTQPVATVLSPEEEKAEREAAEKAAAEKAAKERQEKEAQEQREREAKEKGSGGSGGGSTGTGSASPAPAAPAPPASPVAPKARVTSGPKRNGTATTARFRFRAEPSAGARFECKLDAARWARCGSSKTYRRLKVGKHTFRVRAVAGGLTGAVTKYQFTVKG